MPSLFDEKNALRLQVRQKGASLPSDYFHTSSQNIRENLFSTPAWQKAQTVLLYASIGLEPDTHSILQSAFVSPKRVALPCCLPKGMLEAREVHSLEALTPKSFGILEPGSDLPFIAPHTLDLVIVPCVAMDVRFHRLGHGGGYYDRYLDTISCPVICLCHEAFLLKSIPTEPWDKAVSMIITGERILS